jgi:hypothetical protein
MQIIVNLTTCLMTIKFDVIKNFIKFMAQAWKLP